MQLNTGCMDAEDHNTGGAWCRGFGNMVEGAFTTFMIDLSRPNFQYSDWMEFGMYWRSSLSSFSVGMTARCRGCMVWRVHSAWCVVHGAEDLRTWWRSTFGNFAHSELAYSLIWRVHRIWKHDKEEPLALFVISMLIFNTVINWMHGMRGAANHLLGQGAWCVVHSTEDLDTW